MSQIAITGLLVALLCPLSAFAGVDECNSTGNVDRFKSDNKANTPRYCPKGVDGSCAGHIKKYATIAEEFAAEVDSVCKTVAKTASTDIQGDSQQTEKYKAMMTKLADGYKNLASIAQQKANKVTTEMKTTASATPATAQTIQKIMHLKQAAQNTKGEVSISDVSGKGIQEKASSIVMGSELRKELLHSKDDFEIKANTALENAQRGPNLTTNDGPPADDKKKSGGLLDSLNPSTLMGLATAGMGLAAAMKKPDASGVSAPSDTSPQPTAVAATNLGDGSKAASQSPNMSNSTATKTDLPAAGSGGSPGFNGSPFSPDSDVTSRSSHLAGSGGTSAATPSGSAGLDGFGAGGSGSSRSPDSTAKDPAAALAKAPDDFSAGGFSSGGGGGSLNFGSSSSTSSDSYHAEDPLKETLQDMAAAVDSGNGSTDTPMDSVQADASTPDYASSNEFLFTRVRSAIQRSLKKGAVISGLSAKIR